MKWWQWLVVLSPLATLLHFFVLMAMPHEKLPQRLNPEQPLFDAVSMLIATMVLSVASLVVLLTK